MKFRSTLIFGILFIALAAYVYLYEIKGAERREEAEKKAKEVLSFDKGSVRELKLIFPDHTVHCLKDSGDGWRLIEPIKTDGSEEDIKGLLTSLQDATIRRTVADSAEGVSQYGLDEPQVTVRIKEESEQSWRSLMLGDKSPTSTYAYAMRGDDPAVYLVSSTLLNSLDKNAHDLRFKRVLDFEKDEVNKIILRRGKESIVCSKSLDEWMLEKPIQVRADGDEIDGMVRTLHGAETKDFVAEEPEGLEEYGLKPPELEVDLFTGEKNGIKSLSVGKRAGETYYAKDASRKTIFTVDSSLVSKLRKEAIDLRDKSILAVKPYKVQQIRLQVEEFKLLCRKDTTGTWQILEPIQARADESEINDLLWALEDLKAEEFVSDAPQELTPYGLAVPRAQIEIWVERDSTSQMLSVGREKGENVYVKNRTAPSVYLVNAEILEEVEKDLTDFRDKKVLHFYTYQVKELEITHGNESISWKKDSQGHWKETSGQRAEKSDVTELLSDLQSLKAEEFIDDDSSDLTRYGLAGPQYIVRLQFEEKPSQVLFVGAEQNEEVYVKNREAESVYVTKSDFIDKLRSLFLKEEKGA